MTHFEAYFKIFTVPLQAEFYDKKNCQAKMKKQEVITCCESGFTLKREIAKL